MPKFAQLAEGYPLRSDYERIEGDGRYQAMFEFSQRFLKGNVGLLGEYAQTWVPDPLNTWSRRWEYLYAYEKIASLNISHGPRPMRLMDAGSGLTFFSHFLGEHFTTAEVECFDYDSLVETTGDRLALKSRAANYSTGDLSSMPFRDRTFDAIYCISVLEHCRDHKKVISECARVLTPGGSLILTVDVSLDGKSEIHPNMLREMIAHLGQWFDPIVSYHLLADNMDEQLILTTRYSYETSGYKLLPWSRPGVVSTLRHFLRHGRPPQHPPLNLTCFCMTWIRKGNN